MVMEGNNMLTKESFKIDDEASAYFFGLAITDGSIFVRNGNMCFIFSNTEKCLVEFVSKYIGGNMREISPNVGINRHKNTMWTTNKSGLWVGDLISMGLTVRRIGFKPELLGIPEHLERYVISGMIAGDGAVYQNENLPGKTKGLRFLKFTKTEEIVRYFTEAVERHLGIEQATMYHNGPKDGDIRNKQVLYYNKKGLRIMEWAMENNDLKSERKYKRYLGIKAYYEAKDNAKRK